MNEHWAAGPAPLGGHDVGRGEQNREGSPDGEQGKDNKAQSIHHHGGKLPVAGHVRAFIFLPEL